MQKDTTSLISKSTKRLILVSALIGYIMLVFYILYDVGLAPLVSVLEKANPWIYALAITSLMISITFHTLVWYQLLRSLSIKLSFRRTYKLYWVGVFVDNLIPGYWSGDLFRAYLLNKDPKIQSGKAVASVVAKNVYEAIFNFSSAFIALFILILNFRLETSLIITLVVIMVLLMLPLAVLLLASFKPKSAKKLIDGVFCFLSRVSRNRRNLAGLQKKVEKGLSDYHDGMKELLENPRMLIKPMILSFFAWGFEVITLLLVFASLEQVIPLDKVMIVRSIAGNIEAQGYSLMGYAQIITTQMYTALGVKGAIPASVALLGGVVVFFIKTVISYTAFHYTVIKPSNNNHSKTSQPEKLIEPAGENVGSLANIVETK